MKTETDKNSAQIPLYLGITGHRDLREEDKMILKQMIKDIIEEKKSQCPNTEIVMLTPLAEGADRLGAYAAIESGISFIAPLPLPVEEYRKDFTTKESLNEFNELLEKAEDWFELPLPNGISLEDIQKDRVKRRDQYYNIGVFIAKQSQLLIALWDGIENNKRGGTSEIVNLRKSGLPSSGNRTRKRLLNFQTGLIYQIITPHEREPMPADAFKTRMIHSGYWSDSDNKSVEMDRKVLSHIDSYNRDVKIYRPKLKQKIEENKRRLLADHPETKDEIEILSITEYRSVTSALASYFQVKRYFALRVLLTLVVVAFIFFQIYVEFWHKPVLLLLYPVTMGIGALWFLNASNKRYEQKHEDYRALSEALRVQFYLTISGNKTSVADHYLQKHKGELEWVIYALRAALLKVSVLNKTDNVLLNSEINGRIKFVSEKWINKQLDYYRNTSIKLHHGSEKLERFANRLFFGALGAALLLFLFTTLKEHLPRFIEEYEEAIHSGLIVCTHCLLVISAAIHGYLEKMIFNEQAKTYQHMFQVFRIAREKLSKELAAENLEEACEIIWELGTEALMENADWLLLHRSRPMEIPKG